MRAQRHTEQGAGHPQGQLVNPRERAAEVSVQYSWWVQKAQLVCPLPLFSVQAVLRRTLQDLLPEDSHLLCNGRIRRYSGRLIITFEQGWATWHCSG